MALALALVLAQSWLAGADEFLFFDAVRDGDAALVAESLASGEVDPNFADEDGLPPLVGAVNRGHSAVVGALLDAGADIELAAEFPADVNTPLTAAAGQGDLAMVQLLLGRGAQLDGRGRDGRTPLMTAVAGGQRDVAEVLLEEGADLEAAKADGTTALFWAAQGGFGEMVLLLLNRGARLDRRDRLDGSQPVHFACQAAAGNGTVAALQHLLSAGADPNSRTGVVAPPDARGRPKDNPSEDELEGGRTPLMVGAFEGNPACVQVLSNLIGSEGKKVPLDLADVSGTTALSYAAQANQLEVLDLLLEAGARVDVPSRDGRAALHFAAFLGHFDVAKRLVDAGANVNQPAALTNGAGLGHTPLLIASFQGHYKIVQMLLKHDANIEIGARDGATPLIAAASGGHMKIVKALLKAGANVFRRLESGETAAIVAGDRAVSALLYETEHAKLREMEELKAQAAAKAEGQDDTGALLDETEAADEFDDDILFEGGGEL